MRWSPAFQSLEPSGASTLVRITSGHVFPEALSGYWIGIPERRTMLKQKNQSQVDKAKVTLREFASYADKVVRDERLRTDILAAVGHGTEATNRIREDIDAGSIATRLAADRKLRKKLRATLDDLDHASDRLRRKRRHYIRNAFLVLAGAGMVAAIIPKARSLVQGGADRPSEPMPAI